MNLLKAAAKAKAQFRAGRVGSRWNVQTPPFFRSGLVQGVYAIFKAVKRVLFFVQACFESRFRFLLVCCAFTGG
jgi:hypothetical protein